MCPVAVVYFNVHVLQYRAWRDISRVVLSEAASSSAGWLSGGPPGGAAGSHCPVSAVCCIYQFLFAVCFCVFLRLSLKGN